MTDWLLTHCVGSVRKISYKFPDMFILKSKQSVKIWAKNKGEDFKVNDIVIYDIDNWVAGSQDMYIRLENEYGEEKASYRKTS